MSRIQFKGTGDGAFSADGCAVDLYARLPPTGEPEIVAKILEPGGTILELGAGAGRITRALVAGGYRVTAVDNAPEMLAHIVNADTVLADIESVALGTTFDLVLLASMLINFPEAETRTALIAACARHMRPGSRLLIERHDAAQLARLAEGQTGMLGDVRITVEKVTRRGALVDATMLYECEAGLWRQSFTHAPVEDAEIDALLAAEGLVRDHTILAGSNWILAERPR